MKSNQMTSDELLTPAEVAKIFRVDSKTVTRWATNGRLSSIRTPGGHHRFRADEIYAMIDFNESVA